MILTNREYPLIQFCRLAHINYFMARNILSDLLAMGTLEYVVVDKKIAYRRLAS